MSTIVTENLKRSSETASRSLRGVAAVWANINGTGTIAVRDSFNVASLTDVATGAYYANFTSAMADANFSTPNSGGDASQVAIVGGQQNQTASRMAFACVARIDASGFIDTEFVSGASFGDLA